MHANWCARAIVEISKYRSVFNNLKAADQIGPIFTILSQIDALMKSLKCNKVASPGCKQQRFSGRLEKIVGRGSYGAALQCAC